VHVTLRLLDGLPSLRRPRTVRLIEGMFAEERRKKGFRLVHYAVRANHLHLVCEAEHADTLSRGVQRLASRIARGVNRLWRRRGRLFGDRFHGRVIRSPREARNLLAYVLLNTHKDVARRGQVLLGIDPWSSGKWFDGWADVPPRPPPSHDATEEDATVAPPGSWVLREGWRRHGLIATTERAPSEAELGAE
jgi:putative transposase